MGASSFSATEVNIDGKLVKAYVETNDLSLAADPVVQYMDETELKKQIGLIKSAMLRAAKQMDFIEAARLRDELFVLEKVLKEKE